ncbi:hypothetical protein BD779DRAFT_1472579 [Infundibulicybe gibba]|nr:hypothetical protein BD779DRAFT_1472579 [Infundibulicybe gibba]
MSSPVESSLNSTADEIIRECPSPGREVLPDQRAFNVDLANVSHDRAGVSSIEQEITSPHNNRFVLHDSQGFAAGEVANFNTVKNFIQRRANMPNVKDRLHAIWFCLEIPATNGALLEMGDLKFLDLPLGEVPVVVAFTKLDILVYKYENDLYNSGVYGESIDESFNAMVDHHVKLDLDRTCIHPLRMATRHFAGPLPYVAVSTMTPLTHTLADLVKITQGRVDEQVYLIWALAQRANVDMKIDASIRLILAAESGGGYWRGLASSLFFTNKTLKTCLDAIHKDIVITWNFCDEESYLLSDEFKVIMSHLVNDLGDSAHPRKRSASLNGASAVVGLITALISGGVAAPVGIAIATGMVFAQWVYDVYREAPHVLRCLMGYIVDLTIVMQSLFWMVKPSGNDNEGGPPVGRALILAALEAYETSGDLARVHGCISEFVTGRTVLEFRQRDHVLDEIVWLDWFFKDSEHSTVTKGTPHLISVAASDQTTRYEAESTTQCQLGPAVIPAVPPQYTHPVG